MSDSSVDRPHNATPKVASPMLATEAIAAAGRAHDTTHHDYGLRAALKAFLDGQDRDALTEATALAVHRVTCKRGCEVADGEDYRRARAVIDVLLGGEPAAETCRWPACADTCEYATEEGCPNGR